MARNHQNSTWIVEELQATILKELRVFEAGQQTSPQHQSTPTASFYTAANRRKGYTRRETNSKPNCPYCKGTHSATNCDVNKDVPSFLEVTKKKQLCMLQLLCSSPCGPVYLKKTAAACAVENITQAFVMNLTKPLVTQMMPRRTAQITPPTAVFHLCTTTTNTDTATLTTLTSQHFTRNSTCLLKTTIGIVV